MGEYVDVDDVQTRWPLRTVEDVMANGKGALISGPFGSNISAKYFTASGVPVIRGNNLSLDVGVKFKDADFAFITPDKAEELGTWAQRDDLLFTAVGTIGQVGYLSGKEEYPRYIISNKQIRLRLDTNKLLPLFAYYWFASPQVVELIQQRNTGSSVPLINLGVVRSLPVPVPEIRVQEAVVEVLSSLDAKIDLLHGQNKTLEAMAEALFRQWYLEGDGAPVPVTDLIDFNPSLPLKKGQSAPYLEMKNLQETSSIPDGIRYREFTSGMRFQNGDTLLARISPCLENGKCCYVQCMNEGEVGWGSTEFIVMRSKGGFSPFLSYALAKSPDFVDFASNTLAGSSGRQRAQLEIMMEFQLVRPDETTIETVNAQLDGFAKRIDLNHRQITNLTTLRDTLLPKLMSGEVRVETSTTD